MASWLADGLRADLHCTACRVQGHIVATSPTFSHRLKHVFAEPNAYQPDRYQREWGERGCVSGMRLAPASL